MDATQKQARDAKYPRVGCKHGYFVDTDSTQLPRGRVGLFLGFIGRDGYPDRTMSARLIAGAESVAELRDKHPEAFTNEAA